MIEYFLDTCFLISFFGMKIDIKEFENDFEKILESKSYKFGFSDVSLIEIRYLIERSIRKGAPKELRGEYSIGLNAIIHNNQFQNFPITDVDIVDLEMELLINYQYNDYFDRMIMATSFHNSKYLVTMDREIKSTMKKYIKDNRPRKSSQFVKVISWSEMISEFNL